jgi:site-specific recombinase XerD
VDELRRANVGDIRYAADDGLAVIDVRGTGGKDRCVPAKEPLIDGLEDYLVSRSARFPAMVRRRSPTNGLAAWFCPASVYDT